MTGGDGHSGNQNKNKPAHCKCPGLTGNVWKCGKNLKWIKKSLLSGDSLLSNILDELFGKVGIAFILFIPLWISLIILYLYEFYVKYLNWHIQQALKYAQQNNLQRVSEYIKQASECLKQYNLNQAYSTLQNALQQIPAYLKQHPLQQPPQFFQWLSNILKYINGHFGLILIIVLGVAFILAFFLKKLRVVFYLSLYYLVFYIIILILKDNTYILLSNDELTAILISFTTILFTMLIPIGIAILNKLYRKEEEAFGSLDLRTFRVYRLNPAYFIFWLLVAFVPLLISQTNGINIDAITKINVGALILQSIVVSISFIGVFFLALRLIKIYNWSENEKIEYRKKYLNNAGFDKEFIEAWKSVWIAKGIDEKEEKEYLCIFMRRIIESLSCKEKLDITKKLLKDFKENLSNRRNPKNMEFIHKILIEIAEEMKIGESKTVFDVASTKYISDIMRAIIKHIDNYEWANSDKTCYNDIKYFIYCVFFHGCSKIKL